MDNEDKIISSVLSGDKEAFSQIVLEYQTSVYNLALKMTRNEQDALDISQETFIRAYSSLSSFRGSSRFSTWLYKIAYNLSIDHIRHSSRTSALSLTESFDGSGNETDIPDTSSDPFAEYERKDLRENIDKAVGSLSEEQRRAFIMREYWGLSYKGIAERESIPEGTVKSRISRARREIYDFLVENGTISEKTRQKQGRGRIEDEKL